MKRCVVLHHHREDDAGLVGAALTERGYSLVAQLVDATHPVGELAVSDVVLVLGSSASAYEPSVQEGWLKAEVDALAVAAERGTPVLGICFGAQILSLLCGGSVERAAEPEYGWLEIDVLDGAPLQRGPWFQYHGDRCVLPDAATVWATTALAPQAFTIGRHLGVQFHPEVDGDQLARWFDSLYGSDARYPARERALLAETRAREQEAGDRAAQLVDAFLAHALVTA